MGIVKSRLNYQAAVRDFDRARKQAALEQLMARLTGKSNELLSYNEVQSKLSVIGEVKRGLKEIPLDAIVGSVGRYKDFTRGFLPRRDSDEERWARVRTAVSDMKGMNPIEVYQVGVVYFVKDGNHRVSVARQLGSETISAYVTEVKTRVALDVEADPDELICKARYVEFLEKTNLDKSRPEADLLMTFCGQYQVLLDQIENHRKILGEEDTHEVSFQDLAAHWYDEVYMPVIELMREQGVLRNFPGWTETDLYVLFIKRRAKVQKALGWKIGSEMAVTELAEHEARKSRPMIARLGDRLLDAIFPVELEEGPEPGRWRQKRVAYGRKDRLFADYLVAISGNETDWQMLDKVIVLAQRENDRLLGLHVVSHKSKIHSQKVEAMRTRFEQRCHEAGLPAEFAVETGSVADTIIKRAAWTDLVVTALIHPPDDKPIERLSHGFNQLIQRCPRPILAIPNSANYDLGRLLLAYDGSPKADEALFVATYLASRWPISLVVLTVETKYTSEKDLLNARRYIERFDINDVEYILGQSPIAEAIVETAIAHQSTMLVMGGFGFRPLFHVVLGSTVDRILREFPQKILICR